MSTERFTICPARWARWIQVAILATAAGAFLAVGPACAARAIGSGMVQSQIMKVISLTDDLVSGRPLVHPELVNYIEVPRLCRK